MSTARKESDRAECERKLDQALELTFPASDPIAVGRFALSAHKSRAYEGYAKRTMERALAATRKRHAHRIAGLSNAPGTEFRNEARKEFRNEESGPSSAAK